MGSSRIALVVALLATASCLRPEFEDLGICFPLASGRILVEVRATCAADHKGAKLSCDTDVDGNDVHVTASGHDGRDPNGDCADDLVATCETEDLAAGMYTVHFDDSTFEVAVPNLDESSCVVEI